jgi:hypothetical protein
MGEGHRRRMCLGHTGTGEPRGAGPNRQAALSSPHSASFIPAGIIVADRDDDRRSAGPPSPQAPLTAAEDCLVAFSCVFGAGPVRLWSGTGRQADGTAAGDGQEAAVRAHVADLVGSAVEDQVAAACRQFDPDRGVELRGGGRSSAAAL